MMAGMTLPKVALVDLLTDPDAVLARARAAGPVVESELGPMVVHHDAVRALAQSEKLRPAFSRVLEQFGVSSGAFYDWMSISPLDMEGPQHRVWRQLMLRAFTPKSVERLRPFLRGEANMLIDAFAPAGQCEFIEAFARKLPSAGLCELIGVPHPDRARFSDWADTVGLGFNMAVLPSRVADVDAAITALLDYADELIAARRREPTDDLVTRLAQAVNEEQGITEEMIRGSVAGLVFAGHETTKNQLGWMVAILSEVPDEWERVAREPARAADVVEEVLRFRSTAANFGRMALEDVEIGGVKIAKGTSVLASLWSANRDAKVFPKPDVVAVDENRGGVQVAFGQGAHHCLGAALARAELQEALIALAQRITCPKLEPGATYLPPLGINGPTALPISFAARA
jgi:cytochrome P450